jgi:hypothetical protein
MSHTQRRCVDCGSPAEACAPSCQECGGTTLVTVKRPAFAERSTTSAYTQVLHAPWDEEPMMSCSFCHRCVEAAKVYHSRFDGMPVCWSCKQAEGA